MMLNGSVYWWPTGRTGGPTAFACDYRRRVLATFTTKPDPGPCPLCGLEAKEGQRALVAINGESPGAEPSMDGDAMAGDPVVLLWFCLSCQYCWEQHCTWEPAT